MSDTPTTVLIAGAAALLGSWGKSWYDARLARKSAQGAEAERKRIAHEALLAAAAVADATGRHEVKKAETGMVDSVIERLQAVEERADAERDRCDQRIEQLHAEVTKATARADAAEARCEAAEARCAKAEARCEALAGEIDVMRRSLR